MRINVDLYFTTWALLMSDLNKTKAHLTLLEKGLEELRLNKPSEITDEQLREFEQKQSRITHEKYFRPIKQDWNTGEITDK